MSLVAMGLNHKTAPLALREAAAVPEAEVRPALRALAAADGVKEAALLSTCNRVEVLVDAKTDRLGADAAAAFFRLRMGPSHDGAPLYLHRGADAVRHLLRVVCSLDSQVLGEAQILGQVRRALEQAGEAGTCGEVLGELLRRALGLGKRVRAETSIGADSVSLPALAHRVGMEAAGRAGSCRVLLVGAGEMARLAARYLADDGVGELLVANRTHSRALELAREAGGRAVPFSGLHREAACSDVVFVMTAANGPVLRAGGLARERAAAGRDGIPLTLVDVSVPRNVERECSVLPGVTLHDLEALGALVDEGLARRMAAIPEVERMVDEAERGFLSWMQERLVTPTIGMMYEKGSITVADELERALSALARERGAEVGAGERRILEAYGTAVMKKLLHGPAMRLRKEAGSADSYYYTGAARYLFGIETFPPGGSGRGHAACGSRPSRKAGRRGSSPLARGRCVIGTRGSRLALWQATAAADALRAAVPGLEVEIRVIATQGDRLPDEPLGQMGDKGLFTKELEEALLAGEVDLCVHSMKDLPSRLPAGCVIGAMLPRSDARDALVCGSRAEGARSLGGLPAGTRLGTGSLRRAAQLRALHPQVVPVPMRGNVDTRLRKVARGDYDGAVLAAAGVSRVGAAGRIAARLPVHEMVPAAGQGAVGMEIREGDSRASAWCSLVDDAVTRRCVEAERLVLSALEGGCQAPIGVYARYGDDALLFDAVVLSPDGSRVARVSRHDPAQASPLDVAREVVGGLRLRGAGDILADIRPTGEGR